MNNLASLISKNYHDIVKLFHLHKRFTSSGISVPENTELKKIVQQLVSELLPIDEPNGSLILNFEAVNLNELVKIIIKYFTKNYVDQKDNEEMFIEEMTEVIGAIYQKFWEIRFKHYHKIYAESEQRLLAAVVAAQENERKNLASTLHDDVVQSMAVVLISIQMIQSMISSEHKKTKINDKVISKLIEIEEVLRKTIQNCRLVSFDMDSFWLEKAGFMPTLKAFIRDYENKNKISVSLYLQEYNGRLNRAVEIHFFRVIQEALRNIQKHAYATKVNICLAITQKEATLTVEDNGCGFNLDQEFQNKEKTGLCHFGLFSIEQRSKMLGGSFQVKTAPGCGTKLLTKVPLQNGEHDMNKCSSGRKVSPWIRSG
ncbi:MAG: ATP-binding protein [Bacillota bacterium]